MYYLNVSCSRLITSVWGRESKFFCHRLLVILLSLFEEVSSVSGYFRNVALFYCGTPLVFPITISFLLRTDELAVTYLNEVLVLYQSLNPLRKHAHVIYCNFSRL